MKALSGRWKLLIIQRLLDGPTRTADLRRHLGLISQKMLTEQLRELMADGLIQRESTGQKPPLTVSYSLTPLGQKAAPVVQALATYGRTVMEHQLVNN